MRGRFRDYLDVRFHWDHYRAEIKARALGKRDAATSMYRKKKKK